MLITALFLLLLLGGAAVVVGLQERTQRRARNRRLEALKERHGAGNVIETQLRKITAAHNAGGRIENSFARLLPNPDLLRRRLEMTGRNWTIGQYATGCGIATALAWAALLMRGTSLLTTLFLGLLIGIGLPHFIVTRMAKTRVQKFITRFPDAIELLVRGLRSGLPISETMGVVANELPDPVGSEFRAVADRMRIGRTMEASLQETADKLQTPEFQFFVVSLAIQRETGGNLAETLGNLADVLRKRMQMKLKINAMSSESKASAYIIGSLPFIVFGLIYYINPAYMGTFFTDQRLIYTAMGGGIWMGIGVFIMGKMINFEI
ncbi:type II secretion system F family protein [Sphingomonas sp. AP4-R1]|uniref:type II secretion system F family protein n=1 Tax=Sphingomonas sp. AP4-R1 TaxID=2735134 RepID=UPI0014934C42|nr:type II secretion system F family protein [Sphingomonas sp. AP4-R1]QJU59511.1 type II secretion system F family protein [Sphingomonas sp. AP4-R1]